MMDCHGGLKSIVAFFHNACLQQINPRLIDHFQYIMALYIRRACMAKLRNYQSSQRLPLCQFRAAVPGYFLLTGKSMSVFPYNVINGLGASKNIPTTRSALKRHYLWEPPKANYIIYINSLLIHLLRAV